MSPLASVQNISCAKISRYTVLKDECIAKTLVSLVYAALHLIAFHQLRTFSDKKSFLTQTVPQAQRIQRNRSGKFRGQFAFSCSLVW